MQWYEIPRVQLQRGNHYLRPGPNVGNEGQPGPSPCGRNGGRKAEGQGRELKAASCHQASPNLCISWEKKSQILQLIDNSSKCTSLSNIYINVEHLGRMCIQTKQKEGCERLTTKFQRLPNPTIEQLFWDMELYFLFLDFSLPSHFVFMFHANLCLAWWLER